MINIVRLLIALSLFVGGQSFAIFTKWTEKTGWTNWVRGSTSNLTVPTRQGTSLITTGTRLANFPKALSPTTIDVTAKVVNGASMLVGLGRVLTPIGAVIQLAMIAEELEHAGYTDIKAANTGWKARRVGTIEVTVWTFDNVSTFADAGGACSALAAYKPNHSGGSVAGTFGDSPGRIANCNGTITYPDMPPGAPNTSFGLIGTVFEIPNPDINGSNQVSLSDQQLAKLIEQRGIPDSALDALGNAMNNGTVTPELEPISYSGPSSVPGTTTTTTSTDPTTGNVTTTSTTNVLNLVYAGTNITVNNTATTTTTVRAPNGDVISTDVTTEDSSVAPDPANDPQPDEKSMLCSVFPDILACKTLDDPGTEQMPKETRTLELQAGPEFSGGSCIPNVVISVFGNQITVLDMAQPCMWIETMLKPLILLFASMSAVFIVMPRSD